LKHQHALFHLAYSKHSKARSICFQLELPFFILKAV